MLKRIVMTILLAIVGVGLIVKVPAAYTLPAAMTIWTQGTAAKVQPTTAPGLGNAIFHATGARVRQIPFTPQRVKAVLRDS